MPGFISQFWTGADTRAASDQASLNRTAKASKPKQRYDKGIENADVARRKRKGGKRGKGGYSRKLTT